MTFIVQSLDEAVAIQYNGLTDNTVPTAPTALLGKPLFVGSFKRGVVGKVLQISSSNIKSALGFEPNNPHYRVVSDYLERNRGAIAWVMNVGLLPKNTADEPIYHIFVNDVVVAQMTKQQLENSGYQNDVF